MGLPVTEEVVNYIKTDLPSGKKIGIKRWKVKEERELLFAVEGLETDRDIKKEIIKMISKCVDDQVLFKTLSNVDYVYLLTELRKISKGIKIEFTYKCSNPKCKFELSSDIDLTKNIKIKPYTGGVVKINDHLSFGLREIPFQEFDILKEKYTKTTEYNFNFVVKSIDSVIIDDEVYSEFTYDEIVTKLDTLDSDEYDKLDKAIDESLATIEYEKTLKCKRCDTDVEVAFGDPYYFLAF